MLFTAHIDEMHEPGVGQPPEYVHLDGRSLTIGSSPLRVIERYVHTDDAKVRVATTFEDLAADLRRDGIAITTSATGISQVLTLGAYANPQSALHGVFRMTSEDTLTVRPGPGGVQVDVGFEDRWNPMNSRNDGTPSTSHLRSLIADAVDRHVRSLGSNAALLLSSGKDSVALAIGLADSGHRDVPCITFVSSTSDHEHLYAADLCRRLGLPHESVTPDDGDTRAAFERFFERSAEPSADLTVGATMLLAQHAGLDHGGLLDGTGNDPYMGWIPSGRNRLKWKLRVRGERTARAIRGRIPIDSGINYFTRGALGSLLTLRMFRPRDLRRFFPAAVDTSAVWWDRGKVHAGDPVAFGSESRRTQAEGRTIHKAMRTAEASGLSCELPFRDDEIADYYLHLPEASRIDRRGRTNKVLLRAMLEEAVGYDEAEVGANYFDYDVQRFLLENRQWVRDEILGCSLWGGEIESLTTEWLDVIESHSRLHHAVHALFVVSGWHNHNRYLTHR